MKNATLFVLFMVLGGLFAPSAYAQGGYTYDRGYGRGGPIFYGPGGYRNEYGGGYYGGGGRGQMIGAVAAGVASGAALGYMAGGRNGALIGAGVGGGVVGIAEYAANRAAHGPKPLDCGKRKLSKKEDAACAEYAAEIRQQAELAERQLRGGYLKNASSRWLLEVKDCNVRVAVLKPGQRDPALGARCGYEGTFFVRSASVAGVADEQQAAFIVSDDAGGWVFHVPDPTSRRQGGIR